MPAPATLSLEHITDHTPMGGSLHPTGGGATFRVWAPAAREVRVLWDFDKNAAGAWIPGQAGTLQQRHGGMWAGFVPGLKDGDRYMFDVLGPTGGTQGLKRDPYARDLSDDPMWPDCQCLHAVNVELWSS